MIEPAMHELSIIQSIIDIVLKDISKREVSKVERISLRIGEMRQVVPEALQFSFECLSKNTPVEGARLDIEHVPLRGRCRSCQHEYVLTNWFEGCPECGNTKIDIVAGKELEIVEYEGS